MALSIEDAPREYPDGRPLSAQPRWRQDFPTDIPEDDEVSRREFTKFLVLISGAFAVGQCWIWLTSLFRREGRFPELAIAREKDVSPGKIVKFQYPTDDVPGLLIRLQDGRLVAYGQQCTHLSCAVIPEPDKGYLHCPCHEGYFEISEGRPIGGPPRRPLPRIMLAVRSGVIYATGVERRTV